MKKYIYTILLLGGIFLNSCKDELSDELFIKTILLTQNGLQDYDLEYTDEGIVDMNVVVSINGTSKNHHTVTATLELAPDTLEKYNFERYRNRTILYYEQTTDDMYDFPNGETGIISQGEDKAIIPLRINLKHFDFYKNYILPLRIVGGEPYPIAPNKYGTVLMRFNVSNFFSGNYSVGGKIWEKGNEGQILPVTSGTLNAIASNKCYSYVGNVSDEDEDRSTYTFTVEVNKNQYTDKVDASDAQIRTYSDVTIGSKNNSIQIKDESNGNAWVKVTKSADPLNNNLENVMTQLYIRYSYLNLRNSDYPVRMFFEGTYTKQESVDKKTGEVQK